MALPGAPQPKCFWLRERGPVHVFVDQNPSIHILLTTKDWSRLFSLVRAVDKEKVVILKSVDGTLYHAQHRHAVWVFRLDQNGRARVDLGHRASDIIGLLCETRNSILAEDKRQSPSKWLIEFPFVSPSAKPFFDSSPSKPKIQYKPRWPRPLPLGSSTSVGSVAASSMRTTSRGSGTRGDLAEVSYWKDIFGRAEKKGEVEKAEAGTGEKGNKSSGSLAVSPARQTPQNPDTSGESDVPRQLKVVERPENHCSIQAMPPGPTTSRAHEEIPLTGSRVKRWSRSLRA
ncbi:hypothetical protein B0J17DRAFT_758782 [Rhizoctonia solani]|nr:hypothetical protein B0J17DRAFT_758782 [Rhizoctonia solani]